MADCFKYHEMISCLMDNALSREEQEELDRHIAECEGCRALLEIYKLTFDGEMVEPPAELVSGSMLKIRAAAAKAKSHMRKHIMRYVAVAACFALIVSVVPRLNLSTGLSSSDKTVTEDYTNSGCDPDSNPKVNDINADYLASVTIDGELPELLEGYDRTAVGDGSYRIKVRSCLVAYLDGLGYKPNYNSGSESDWSLVIYNP